VSWCRAAIHDDALMQLGRLVSTSVTGGSTRAMEKSAETTHPVGMVRVWGCTRLTDLTASFGARRVCVIGREWGDDHGRGGGGM